MTNKQKIFQLREEIFSSLNKIVGKKCILLDAPYYHNIGDVLIWTGVQCYMHDNGIQCLYTASYETCTFPKIEKDVTVLFNGGGNLGDLYPEHMKFLISITEHYPNNRIVVLPQTVYYKNVEQAEFDISRLKQHSDFYICARDQVVYSRLRKYFDNRTLLLPDMAFCISSQRLNPYRKEQNKEKLIIKRDDCEKGTMRVSQDGDISDWPVFVHSFRKTTFANKLFKRTSDAKIPLLSKVINSLWNWYAPKFFNKMMVREGVEFISPYRCVETVRLHGCILSILLDKEIILVNNSYGKNKDFYDSWLTDLETINLKC